MLAGESGVGHPPPSFIPGCQESSEGTAEKATGPLEVQVSKAIGHNDTNPDNKQELELECSGCQCVIMYTAGEAYAADLSCFSLQQESLPASL